MIEEAEKKGLIGPDTVIVEPTSGNQGIGLALIGAVKGYKTVIIMPDSVSEERRKLVRHYGASVVLIHDEGNIGECIDKCLATAVKMAGRIRMCMCPSSFLIRIIPWFTGIIQALRSWSRWPVRSMDFCSGIGTGGTISGIGEVLKALNPQIEIWAVEPENAAILAGGTIGTHLQMGIGDGLIPENLNQDIYDDIYVVTDEEAIRTARDLARMEGIMCGHLQRNKRCCSFKAGQEAGKGKDGSYGAAGYGREILFNSAV